MKPNWKDAPVWANYLAMDDDGCWYWFSEKPFLNLDCREWECREKGVVNIAYLRTDEWMNTLEGKPDVQE